MGQSNLDKMPRFSRLHIKTILDSTEILGCLLKIRKLGSFLAMEMKIIMINTVNKQESLPIMDTEYFVGNLAMLSAM
jgi:hypothetical protein